MRPPICAICRKDFRHNMKGGGSVRFERSAEEKARWEALNKPGYVGHPPGLEWFCEKHLASAKAHRHLTWREAAQLIKALEE
ncbi:MAG: hypothetical protein AB8G15_10015 [Saprospiraceae bacterium]